MNINLLSTNIHDDIYIYILYQNNSNKIYEINEINKKIYSR